MKILNKRTASKEELKDAVYVGRPSAFGNPFQIGRDGDRHNVINKYREWFKEKIQNDDRFFNVVNSLRGKNLVCWCSPKQCHAEVILEYLGESFIKVGEPFIGVEKDPKYVEISKMKLKQEKFPFSAGG